MFDVLEQLYSRILNKQGIFAMSGEPSARLRAAIEEIGIPQRELAKAIGVSVSGLNMAANGKSAVTKALIGKLSDRFQVNPLWIEYGLGEMFLARGDARPMPEPPGEQDKTDNYVRVARYRVSASAGGGSVNYDEAPDGYIVFPRTFMKEIGVTGTDCGLVEVTGDSMGYTIRPGSLALVDFSVRQFVSRKIFILRQGDQIRVKRVLPGEDGIALMSDNPMYEDEVLTDDEADELVAIGQVRAVISKV